MGSNDAFGKFFQSLKDGLEKVGVPSQLLTSVGGQRGTSAQRAEAWRRTGIIALRDMNLKSLPEAALSAGPDARTLDATGNSLTALPEAIGRLSGLTKLIISSNHLESLPSSLGSLSSLRVLLLDSNRLSSLPDVFASLRRLERLSVARNQLQSLPPSVGQLRAVRQLHAAAVVKGLGGASMVTRTWFNWVLQELQPALQVLDASSNKLNALPATIGSCTALEQLLAKENSLSSLPPSLEDLASLTVLDLESNHLIALPPDLLRKCGKLHTLSVRGNKIGLDYLEQMEAYEDYEKRRKDKVDKRIAANVLLHDKTLDVGADRA